MNKKYKLYFISSSILFFLALGLLTFQLRLNYESGEMSTATGKEKVVKHQGGKFWALRVAEYIFDWGVYVESTVPIEDQKVNKNEPIGPDYAVLVMQRMQNDYKKLWLLTLLLFISAIVVGSIGYLKKRKRI